MAREAAEIEKGCSKEIWSANIPEITNLESDTTTVEDYQQAITGLKQIAEKFVTSTVTRANKVAELGTLSCEVLERRLFAASSADKIVNAIAPKIQDHMTVYPLITPAGKILTFKLNDNGEAVKTDLPPEYEGMEVYVNRRLKRGFNRGNNFQAKRSRNFY